MQGTLSNLLKMNVQPPITSSSTCPVALSRDTHATHGWLLLHCRSSSIGKIRPKVDHAVSSVEVRRRCLFGKLSATHHALLSKVFSVATYQSTTVSGPNHLERSDDETYRIYVQE
jgi:hypothetical protein